MTEDTIRVLLVDDDEDEDVLTRDLLAGMRGYRVDLTWVGTYDAGLDALGRGAYDAALVDYRLGVRTGLDLMRAAAAVGCATPIILLTGQGDRAVDVAAMEAGAADYVIKGQGAATLERALRYAITQARLGETLRANEARFRALSEHASDLVQILDADGVIRYASPSHEPLLGYVPAALLTTNACGLVHPDDRARAAERLAAQVRGGDAPGHLTLRLRHADGSWRIMDVIGANHLDDPTVVGIIVTGRDVTTRAQMEEALRASEERFRGAFAHTAVGMGLLGLDGRFLQVNAAICQIIGYSTEELLRTTVQALTHPEDREQRLEAGRALLAGHIPYYQGEFRYVHKDGRVVWGAASITLLRDGQGRPVHFIAQLHDITPRKVAEEALRASEARFRRMVTTAQEGVVVRGPTGLLTYVNARMAEMLGYRAVEMVGQPLVAFMDEDVRAEADAGFQRRAAGIAERFEFRFRRQDGAPLWAIVSTTPLLDERGVFVESLGMVTDITERVRAEEALCASERDHRALMEQAADGIFLLDHEGRFLDVNARACTLLGYDHDELLRFSIPDVMDPADLAATPVRVAEMRAGKTVVNERRMRRKDGVLVRVEISAKVLTDGRMQAIARDITERVRAREELERSAAGLAAAQRLAHLGSWEVDPGGGESRWSDEIYRIFGVAPRAFTPTRERFLQIVHPDDRAVVAAALERHQEDGEAAGATCRIVRPDGEVRVIEYRPEIIRDAGGQPGRLVGIVQDITERVRGAEALRASEASLAEAQRIAQVGNWDLDLTTHETCWSAELYRIYGVAPGTLRLTAETILDLVHPDDRAAIVEATGAVVSAGRPYSLDYRIRRPDGVVRTLHTEAEVVRDAAGRPVRLRGTAQDVTARVQAEVALRHQARHDALTDLPNRALLHERVAAACGDAADAPRPLALLLLDLDHFKEVNDTFGHERGDGLLRQVAERLRVGVRVGDTVARLGGDEFAVLLPGADAAGAARVAADLRTALDAPLHVEGQALQVGASIGIALGPAHGADGTTLLRHADVAMYAAKRGRTGHAVYAPAQDQHSAERLALVGDLRAAIEGGALALHYQPQVDLTSGRVCGVEALVRWPHPQRGLIPPDAFIPLAEQTGLIAPLTAWVLTEAVRQGRAWQRAGFLLAVSVNLSMWNLHDPALPERVAALLREQGLPPAWLRLELTEGALMADPERALDVLTRLAALGVRLAVDDFGAGYSSLAYLKKLPVDELKIDKGFVREMATDATDAAIVASTVGLGHALGLRVVAEGIENRATWDRLATMGCDVAQGYYMSRPLPAAALARWLRDSAWAVA